MILQFIVIFTDCARDVNRVETKDLSMPDVELCDVTMSDVEPCDSSDDIPKTVASKGLFAHVSWDISVCVVSD